MKSSHTALLLPVLLILLSINGYLAIPVVNANVKVPAPRQQSDNSNNTDKLQRLCLKICDAGHPCPPECVNLLDPWAFDSVQTSVNKRSTGIDGFSFDDYLFLRWLGRDMKRHRLL